MQHASTKQCIDNDEQVYIFLQQNNFMTFYKIGLVLRKYQRMLRLSLSLSQNVIPNYPFSV